ncbi:hypothetical protein [Rhodoferax mekongensis]|uniref:Integrase n=1 Tax=Rhodoferax mekongensis TaxID=3068341 RepID=A0ABZ0B230_9BURK|nr:hypothetical protein [Rhodoferax sp. TBRC 17307]WNO05970.1 hypothetical protein RAN89_05960 [Rhodoferax sp. TBRC 17307]
MSKVDYKWMEATPPKPDVYMTRRNKSNYLTLRYWDGVWWYEIALSNSRGGKPFKWPKPSAMKKPAWVSRPTTKLHIRKISSNLSNIQWGVPFKVFDEKEVLAYLVRTGVLPSNWRSEYQQAMRNEELLK